MTVWDMIIGVLPWVLGAMLLFGPGRAVLKAIAKGVLVVVGLNSKQSWDA